MLAGVIDLEVIEDARAFLEFQWEWTQFTRRLATPTPFQTPEWLGTWWRHFGSGALRVIVFRDSGNVVGVLPCFLHEWNGKRQLSLIGSGITDDLDPLFQPDSTPAILPTLDARLKRWTDWDLCDWQDLSEGTPLRALGETVRGTPSSAVALEQPFEAFLSSRPRPLRRSLRHDGAKAEAIAPVKLEVCDTARPELLDALVRLHRLRWEKAGETGMIAANRSEPFLREAADRLAHCDALRIFTLRWQDRVTAIILAFRNQATLFGYLSAYDPQFEEFGFGRELLARTLRHTQESGYRRWDFLRGNEPYKFDWGARPAARCRLLIRR